MPNRITTELRTMIRQALEAEGGVRYLRRCAREQPVAFMSLLGRLIPAEIRASLEADSETLVVIRDFTGIEWEEAARKRAKVIEAPEVEL